MNELIKVNFAADRLTVSARDLHEFLGVKSRYNDWFRNMTQYGFTEGVDFYSIFSKTSPTENGGRPQTDAALTIDMAKEICMVTRNEKGKQARLYFIQLEKDWNSPEKVMARALKIADAKINALTESNRALTENNAALQAKIELDAPKVLYADTVAGSKTGMLIREFCKFLRPKGVEIGEKRAFADMREGGWLIKTGRDKNKPTQKAVEMGLFTVKETAIQKPSGETVTRTTPLLTGKGRQYFTDFYLSKLTPAVEIAAVVT